MLKVNYSFSRDAGPAQMLMWNTAGFFILEIPLGLYYNTSIIFLEGVQIILLPFMFNFPYDLTFFFTQYNMTFLMNLIIMIIYNKRISAADIILYRILHILLITLFINTRNKVSPLRSFIISREITHSKN